MPTPGIPATDVATRAPDASVASVWSHLVLEIDVPEENGWPQAIQKRLDEIAAQGWELVAVTSVVRHQPAPSGMEGLAARDALWATFKRLSPA